MARKKPKPAAHRSTREETAPAAVKALPSSARMAWFICAGLALLTIAVYGQVFRFEFVHFDDSAYVTGNPQVQAGLSWTGIVWAFTTDHACNWHPLTWLSLMTDVQLFGVNAGGHHIVNALFHLANTLLLFLVLRAMTRADWPSAFVAAMFAVHPLHAESVAWVSERKDVLSTFFWLLAMAAYARYVRRPGVARYAVVASMLAVGLLAKPMLVTLPAVLLLMDYWPLRRMEDFSAKRTARLAVEKLPLFAVVAMSSIATVVAQRSGGGVVPFTVLPMAARVGNALVAYVRYLEMTCWPVGLAFFYPHAREAMPAWQPILAALVLAGLTAGAALLARRAPYVPVGWLWFLGTLVPVIGIVQVGDQALADRYTYVPLTGLFIVAAWGGKDLAARWRLPRWALPATGGALVAIMTVCGAVQASYWRNSIALFNHALEVTTENRVAHKALGVVLTDQAHRYPEAEEHCRKAIELDPSDPDGFYNLGNALSAQNKLDEAVAAYRKAIALKPDYINAHYNLGNALAKQQHYAEAAAAFSDVLRLAPNHPQASNNLGSALVLQGKFEEAAGYYTRAVAADAGNLDAWCNLGYTQSRLGRSKEAAEAYKHALALDPHCAKARDGLKNLGITE